MCRDGSACDIGDEVGLGEDIQSTELSTYQGRVLDVRTRSRSQLERVLLSFEGKACKPDPEHFYMHAATRCYQVQSSQVLQSA